MKLRILVIVLLIGMTTLGANKNFAKKLVLQNALVEQVRTGPSDTVRVIVQARTSMPRLARFAESLGGVVTTKLEIINGFTLNIKAEQLPMLASDPDVKWISLDDTFTQTDLLTSPIYSANLATNYPRVVGAVDLWNAGMMGKGIAVAVLDSGMAAVSDYSQRVIISKTFNPLAKGLSDSFGHGTHVAGIIGGNGAMSNGKYIGIAPKANLLNLKFTAEDGSATESDLLAALNWVFMNRTAYNIRVVNLSSGGSTAQSYTTSPTCAAVEQLWTAGVVVVVSAGNRGANSDAAYYPPANDPFVITVGAFDDKVNLTGDVQTTWSSRGVTQDGFIKPDILAPGAQMISTKAGAKATLIEQYPDNIVDTNYFRMGGTSMATPVVSGAVALMLEQSPTLTPNQIKWILKNTGMRWNLMQSADAKLLNAYAATMYAATIGNVIGLENQGLTPSLGGGVSTSTDSTGFYWNTNY